MPSLTALGMVLVIPLSFDVSIYSVEKDIFSRSEVVSFIDLADEKMSFWFLFHFALLYQKTNSILRGLP